MTRYFILVIVSLLVTSCSQKTIGYNQFYDDYKDEATLALGVPKWSSMPFLEEEDRMLIRDLTEPMSMVKLMFDERSAISKKFKEYAFDHNYASHQSVKANGELIDIYTRETSNELFEIVLSIPSEDGISLVNIQGNTDYDKFLMRIKRHLPVSQ